MKTYNKVVDEVFKDVKLKPFRINRKNYCPSCETKGIYTKLEYKDTKCKCGQEIEWRTL